MEVGNVLPPFEVNSTRGKPFRFPQDLGKPLAVVVVYRKNECKPCRAQLTYLSQAYLMVQALGAEILALSYPPIEEGVQVRAELHLPYHLLSDPQGKVLEILKAINIDKWHASGSIHSGLLYPTIFLADAQGKILHKLVTKKTATEEEFQGILEILKKLQK